MHGEKRMNWVSDGDGVWEALDGRIEVSRRYHPCGLDIGWGVDVEGVSGTAFLADTFVEARTWATTEACQRGWLFRLTWKPQGHGEQVARLRDDSVLIAKKEYYETASWWICHRKQGDDVRELASAISLAELKRVIREMGEEAYL